jgi:ATP:corrinoid adenosyltransferase
LTSDSLLAQDEAMKKETHLLPGPQRKQLLAMFERDGKAKTCAFIGLAMATVKAAAYGLPIHQGTVAHIVQKLKGEA